MSRNPVIIEHAVRLNAPRADLWPVLGDTDRLNRAQGLPPVTYYVLPKGGGAAEIEGEYRFGRLRIRWVEHPFEWVEGQRHFVRRTYRNGPFVAFAGGISLADADEAGGGTLVTMRAEFTPRHALGSALIRLARPRLVRDFERLCRAVEAELAAGRRAVLPGEQPPDGAAVRRRIERVLARQDALSPSDALVARLAEYLATSPDRQAARVRPFALAREWRVPPMELLRTCLRATRAGLLELTWDVICPGCRGAKGRSTTLSALKGQAHCDTCQIRFDVNFDQAVEVTFRPHPQVRAVEDRQFCAFGPANTPHVVAQLLLEAGARVVQELALSEGRYRLRSPGAAAAAWLDAASTGASGARVGLTAGLVEAAPAEVSAGSVRLEVSNGLPAPARLLVERAEWAQDAATASAVTAVQDFRDLFAAEALSPETQLGIACLTFLFTDLKGSTSLYAGLGDARAYALVRDHFRFLADAVRAHDGAIVKTIGDAIMAVFHDPCQALRCGLRVQATIADFNRAHPPGAVVVKMGLHSGPCLAVRLNDMLDYFGTTVNVAARVQGLSEGGDIVITEAIARDSHVCEVLAEQPPVLEKFVAELKGLEGAFAVHRLWPAAARSIGAPPSST